MDLEALGRPDDGEIFSGGGGEKELSVDSGDLAVDHADDKNSNETTEGLHRSVQQLVQEIEALKKRLDQVEQHKANDGGEMELETDTAIDADELFPQDCYSLIAVYGILPTPQSVLYVLFALGVFVFQMALATMVTLGVVGQVGGDDDEKFDAANFMTLLVSKNAGWNVRVSQFLATLAFIVFPESCVMDLVQSIRYLVPAVRYSHHTHGLKCASLLKWIQSSTGVVATWFLILRSQTVLEVLLNFAAINFVTSLDENAFELAKMGVWGPFLREETQRIAGETPLAYKLPYDAKNCKPLHVYSVSVMVVLGLSFSVSTLTLFAQHTTTNE